ncbi:MAG: MerR family transcriptional regulator [Planctomycetes bacterium]|nr:MerR family transcriptional regulator [Planctomycetota bacterium]
MHPVLTIGHLARDADVRVSTVRFYEREGLLRPDGRTSGGFRVYTPETLERLRFIRAAQAMGFTLDDVAYLLKFDAGRLSACGKVQVLIEGRMKDLDRRMKDLQRVRAVLRKSLRKCKGGEKSGSCFVLKKIRIETSSKGKRTS